MAVTTMNKNTLFRVVSFLLLTVSLSGCTFNSLRAFESIFYAALFLFILFWVGTFSLWSLSFVIQLSVDKSMLPDWFAKFWVFFLSLLIVVAEVTYLVENPEMIRSSFGANHSGNIMIELFVWGILLVISLIGVAEIKARILLVKNKEVLSAYIIAIIIGLFLVILLFLQPYLTQLFSIENNNGEYIKVLLFGGGAGTGWVVWYAGQLKKYGEFYYILLLTITVGFAWYARFTAPAEVRLIAASFVMGSLYRIATDRLDKHFAATQSP